jgi:hypothetical protein
MGKLQIVTYWVGHGAQKNEGQIPNVRVVRVNVSTGYNPGEGNRRASRNRRVSDLVTIRNFSIDVRLAPPSRGVDTPSRVPHPGVPPAGLTD